MIRSKIAVRSALAVLFCFFVHLGVIGVAQVADFGLGPTTPSGNSLFSLGLLLFTAVGAFLAFVAIVYAGFEDRTRDALYWPFALLVGSVTLYLSTIAINVLDLLLHGFRTEWTFLYRPVVQLYAKALFATFGASLLWISGLIIFNRLRSVRRVVVFYAIAALALVAVSFLIIAGDRGWLF